MKSLNRKLIIGSAQFSGSYGIKPAKIDQTDLNKINKILQQHKIFSFDTAPFYLKSSIKLKKIVNSKSHVYTKVKYKGNFPNLNTIIDNLLKQKNDLKIDKFKGVFIHDFEINQKNDFNNLIKVCNLLKESKISSNIGFSIYEVETLKFILKNIDFQILQLPINILNQKFIKYLPDVKNYKIKIFARSIFMQGALIETPSYLYKIDKEVFDKYRKWLLKNNLDPVAGCLGYVHNLKNIDHIIIGINNFNELNQILSIKLKKHEYFINFQSKVKKLIDPRYWIAN